MRHYLLFVASVFLFVEPALACLTTKRATFGFWNDSVVVGRRVTLPANSDTARLHSDTPLRRDTVEFAITNHRSILFYPTGRWGIRRSEVICTEFLIAPLRLGAPVDSLVLTSTGLGTVHLWRGDLSLETDCALGKGTNPLVISGPHSPTIIRARIGPLGLNKGFKALNGSVTVFVPGSKRVEIPISIQERTPSRFTTATLWFLGILVPAIIGAFIGYIGKVVTDRNQAAKLERDSFYTFIAGDGGNHVKRLFENFYPGIIDLLQPGIGKPDAVRFCRELRDELRERQILAALPHADRDELLALLDKADAAGVQTKLTALFPLYGPMITPK